MPTESVSTTRVILHVDMDAFFASVEQRDHPAWRGQPLVVGAAHDRRGVVAAASYEARVFGIRSAMPSREAYRRCPHAVFVPPDGKRYHAVSRQVFEILGRYTPWVEPLSIDEAFLDVTGSRGLFGDGETIARRIRADIQGELDLTASVGVAPNKFLAKLGSELHKPDGLTRMPFEPAAIARFLAPLPISRIWGVGAVLNRQLSALGVQCIGDLQTTAEQRLAQALGAHTARHLRMLAYGLDQREVESESEAKSLSHEHTFECDCTDLQTVRNTLLGLVQSVGARLRTDGRYASSARLKLRWADFQTLTRQRQFAPPVCDDTALIATAQALLYKIPQQQAIRLIGFGVAGLVDPPAEQLELFPASTLPRARHEALSQAVDRIRAHHGDNGIKRAAELNVHKPPG